MIKFLVFYDHSYSLAIAIANVDMPLKAIANVDMPLKAIANVDMPLKAIANVDMPLTSPRSIVSIKELTLILNIIYNILFVFL